MKSPIEEKLASHLEPMLAVLGWSLRRQVRIGKYTADFVVEIDDLQVVVEADGYSYHEKTIEQAVHDRVRDRWFLRLGIATVRFLSTEIFDNAEACATELIRTVRSLLDKHVTLKVKAADAASDYMLAEMAKSFGEVLCERHGSNGLTPLWCPIGSEGCVGASGENFCGSYHGDRVLNDRHFVKCSELVR